MLAEFPSLVDDVEFLRMSRPIRESNSQPHWNSDGNGPSRRSRENALLPHSEAKRQAEARMEILEGIRFDSTHAPSQPSVVEILNEVMIRFRYHSIGPTVMRFNKCGSLLPVRNRLAATSSPVHS